MRHTGQEAQGSSWSASQTTSTGVLNVFPSRLLLQADQLCAAATTSVKAVKNDEMLIARALLARLHPVPGKLMSVCVRLHSCMGWLACVRHAC